MSLDPLGSVVTIAVGANAATLVWLVWWASAYVTRFKLLETNVSEHHRECTGRMVRAQETDKALVRVTAMLESIAENLVATRGELADLRKSILVEALGMGGKK
jgi:hypothetical protein